MNILPKITVIVPNYNKQDYLEECLESIRLQTFQNFECIIIDDGSTDCSKDIIDLYCRSDSRFKAFYNQNHGLAYSRNFGIKNALGTFILPVDSDDYISNTYLQRGMNAFEKDPAISLFYGRWKFVGHNSYALNCRFFNLHYTTYENLLVSNSIHCSCIYRKDNAITCGLYDESMKAYEDWDFLIRLLDKNSKVVFDPAISLYYRQFEQSMSSYGHQHYQEIFNYIKQKNSHIFNKNI